MGPLFGAISCHEICAVSGVDAMAVLVAMHHQEMERHELLIRLGLVLIDAAFSLCHARIDPSNRTRRWLASANDGTATRASRPLIRLWCVALLLLASCYCFRRQMTTSMVRPTTTAA